MRPTITWVVTEGDGATVGEVLGGMRSEGVVVEGRVFVNGRHADPADPVDPGDRLELYPQRVVSEADVTILAQRDGVMLVAKPAGLPAETTRLGEDSVVSAVLTQLGGGHVHAATRLDTMVSGVMVLTLGRDAGRRMVAWRERGHIARTYVALATGTLEEDEGEWDAPLRRSRDRGGRHRAVIGGHTAKEARTRYRVLGRLDEVIALELTPQTGRMHQLRAHAAHAGLPLVGDRTYGGERRIAHADGTVIEVERVMLHAVAVSLPHLQGRAALPRVMREAILAWGGDERTVERLNSAGLG